MNARMTELMRLTGNIIRTGVVLRLMPALGACAYKAAN